MTELLEQPLVAPSEPATIEKVSIVVSKGSLEGVYPALIMANGARMEGIEADLFFTFFGLDAVHRERVREALHQPIQPEEGAHPPPSPPVPRTCRSQ